MYGKWKTALGVLLVTLLTIGAWAGNDEKAKALYFSAEEHFSNKEYSRTIAELTKAIKVLGETNPLIQVLLSRSYFESGDYKSAKREIDRFFSLVPEEAQGSPDYITMEDLKQRVNSAAPSGNTVSQPQSSDSFFACGKEWKMGKDQITWDEAQAWVKKLGGNWKSPTRADLDKLFCEFGPQTPLKEDYVWAEANDASTAWVSCCGGLNKYVRNLRAREYRAVALRETTQSDSLHSPEDTEAFVACGKKWKAGRYLSWPAAQAWISSLGNGWRAPTRQELKELRSTLMQNSPISGNHVWAESKDPDQAWNLDFKEGDEGWYWKGPESGFFFRENLAVAVCSQ